MGRINLIYFISLACTRISRFAFHQHGLIDEGNCFVFLTSVFNGTKVTNDEKTAVTLPYSLINVIRLTAVKYCNNVVVVPSSVALFNSYILLSLFVLLRFFYFYHL